MEATSGPAPLPPPPTGWPAGAPPAPVGPARTLDLSLTPERFVRWAGLILIVLSAIFLVSTAIQRGWIGPELQLAGATAGGLALLGAAFLLRDAGPGWPPSLGISGATVLAFCATATHTWLDLVPPSVALVAVGLATAVSVAAAWRLARQSVAFAAGLAALWVPPLLDLPNGVSPALLTSALALAAVAATAVGLIRPWPVVRAGISWVAASMLLVVLLGVDLERGRVDARVAGGLDPTATVIVGAAVAAVTAALWLGPVVHPRLAGRRRPTAASPTWFDLDGDQLAVLDHRLLAVVGGWCWLALIGLTGLDRSRSIGWLGLGVAAGFAALAAVVWRWLPRTLSLAQILGVSAVTGVALVALIDGPLLLVALTAQTVATGLVAHRFRDPWMGASASITGAAAALLVTADIARTLVQSDPTVGGAVAQLTVLLAAAAAALVAARQARRDLAVPAFLATWLLGLAWVLATFVSLPQGNGLVSGLWAALACGAIVGGLRWGSPTVRTTGLTTLVLAVGKLLTVDLATVDVFWRVGLFFVVGAGLLRLAYVLPRLTLRAGEQPTERGEERAGPPPL